LAFELHHRLAADCFEIATLPLCQVLLMNDARFPWCILVPQLDDLRDFHEIPRSSRKAFFDEIEAVSLALEEITGAEKMNVAALGNQVPQLHIHVIARKSDDAAWPAPVWNAGPGTPYEGDAADVLIGGLRERLG